MQRLPSPFLPLIAFVLAACSSPDAPSASTANLLPVEDAGITDDGSQGLGSQIPDFDDPDVRVCIPSDLGGACSGSQEYRSHEICTDAERRQHSISEFCTGGHCLANRTCVHYANGWAGGGTPREVTIPQTTECAYYCTDAEPPLDVNDCRGPIRRRCSVQPPVCYGFMALDVVRNQLRGEGAPAAALTGLTAEQLGAGSCRFRVTGIPRPLSGNARECGCLTCQHQSCGTETAYRYTPPESNPPEPARTPLACTTAETNSEVAIRWQRLRDSWSRPNLPDVDRNRVAARARTMLELYADRISHTERRQPWVFETFSRGNSDLACEVPPRPITMPSGCAASVREPIVQRLHMCERIAQNAPGRGPRVTGSVARVLLEDCLDMLDRLRTNPECEDDQVAARSRIATFRVLLRSLDALTESRSTALAVRNVSAPSGASGDYATIPDLARALRGIDRWFSRSLASEIAHPVEGQASWSHAHLDEARATLWRRARAVRQVVSSLCPNLGAYDANGDCISDLAPDAAPSVLEETDGGRQLVPALTLATERIDLLQRHMLLAAYQETAIPEIKDANGVTVLPEVSITASDIPMHGEPLLLITADALSGFEERFASLAPYHQFACRLGTCGERPARGAQVDWRVQPAWAQARALIANLDDESATGSDPFDFQRAVAQVGPSFAAQPGAPQAQSWQSVFQRIARRQAVLESAVDGATRDVHRPAEEHRDLATAALVDLAPGAVPLASIVRRAEDGAASFAATGLLDPTISQHELRTIVSEDGRRGMIASIKAAADALDRGVGRFEATRRAAVADVLTQLNADQAQDAIDDRQDELTREAMRLTNERLALEATLREYEIRYARTTDAMAMMSGSLDRGAFIPVGDTRHFEARGHNARSGLNARDAALQYAAARGLEEGAPEDEVTRIAVPANHMVSLRVSGEYSPLCALQGYEVGIPDSDESGSTLPVAAGPGTTIGPEGFEITHSGSETQVRSVGDPGIAGSANNVIGTLCGAALTAVSAYYTGGAGAGLAKQTGMVNGACGMVSSFTSWLGGAVDPVRSSSSAEANSTVRFQGGLRLRNTPFPVLPAGALFILEVPRGRDRVADAVDIHMVHSGATSFLVRDDADLYFVINDAFNAELCGELSPEDDPHAIQIEMRLMQSQTAAAEQVVQSMGEVLQLLRNDRAMIVSQGSFLPTQQAAYRHQALSEVQARTNGRFGTLPETVRNVFDTFVSYELARTEVATEIANRERRIGELQTQLEALTDDDASARSADTAAELLPLNTFRSIDSYSDGTDQQQLRWQAQRLMRLMVQNLIPLLELWHPEVLHELLVDPELRSEPVLAALRRLANATSNVDATSLVDDVLFVAQEIIAAYESSPITHLNSDRYTVGLSFERPGSTTARSGFPRASAELAATVWNAAYASVAVAPSQFECTADAQCTTMFGPGLTCRDRRCSGAIACVDTNDADEVANECAVRTDGEWRSLSGFVCRREACVVAPTSVEIPLLPSALYRNGGAGGHVACQNAAPIVQRSALVFAVGQDYNSATASILESMSTAGRSLVANIDPNQSFALLSGPATYRQLDPRFLERPLPLVYTFRDRVTPDFTRFARVDSGHRGSSVFSTTRVDFAPVRTFEASRNGVTGTYRADEIILAMEIDAVPSTRVEWAAPCAPPPTTTVPITELPRGGSRTGGGTPIIPGAEEM